MKSLILSAILILTLNYCGAQPQFIGGKPQTKPKTAKSQTANGIWLYDPEANSYCVLYKLNAVNLQKSIAEFKKLLELNGTTEYKDRSIWSKYTDTTDYSAMMLDIITGNGELLMVQSIGDYVYGIKCSQESESIIALMVIKLTK